MDAASTEEALDVSETSAAGGRRSSRLDHIKARRREIADKKSLTLVVPGYACELGVVYKAIPRPEIEAFADKVERAKAGEKMATNADLVIRCCTDIVVRQDTSAEWESLNLDSPDGTTFGSDDSELADLVGGSFGSTREEVFAFFSPEGGQPLALETHAQAVVSWLQGK